MQELDEGLRLAGGELQPAEEPVVVERRELDAHVTERALPRAARDGPEYADVPKEAFSRAELVIGRLAQRSPGAQEELGIRDQALAGDGAAVTPADVQLADLAGREPMLRNGVRHALAMVSVGARHGHEMLRRRVRDDPPRSNLVLNDVGQLAGERQSATDPAWRPLELTSQVHHGQREALPQLLEQPGLLEDRFALGRAD